VITYRYLGLRGRLGNQMFQYATLYAIAKENNYEFGIPFKYKENNDDYQKLGLLDCFENISAKDCSNFTPSCQIQELDNMFDSSFFEIKDNSDLFGYFQTEKYFKKYKNELIKEFTFKKEIKEKISNKKQKINNPLISIHMRFGDYEKFPDVYPRCGPEYYLNGLSLLPDNCNIILFSDDLNKASSLLQKINKKFYTFDGLNNYEDLCFMSLCDYHIIANSSFSWWGAWLANSKKVIAPAKWYGTNPNAPKNWNDIYCENWEVI